MIDKRQIETMEQLIEEIRKVPGLAESLLPEFTDPRTDFAELYEKFRVAYLGLRPYPSEKIDPE
jgi:hypothetical protein